MSFVARGVVEEFYPGFFEPKPVSPKKLYADNSGNIHIRRKPVIKRRPEIQLSEPVSILGKRKLADAFGEEIYNDQDRYGQDIPADFFKNNIGHGAY
jgi:hypothetical protein